MNNGTVKFYNDSKGFGFIKDANSPKEYFVHSSGLKDSIRENDEVTFDLQAGKKGLNAVNVKLAQFICYRTFKILSLTLVGLFFWSKMAWLLYVTA